MDGTEITNITQKIHTFNGKYNEAFGCTMINCGGDGHVSTMSDVPLGLQLWAMAVLICYYHQGQLSIQKLWFYIQPCMRTMEILSLVAVAIDKVGKFCILLFIHM